MIQTGVYGTSVDGCLQLGDHAAHLGMAARNHSQSLAASTHNSSLGNVGWVVFQLHFSDTQVSDVLGKWTVTEIRLSVFYEQNENLSLWLYQRKTLVPVFEKSKNMYIQ